MAFTRKALGSGQLAITETTMYAPANTAITGVIGSITFYNSHTSQVEVTIYRSHTGAADATMIVEKVSINPGKTHICREMVNKVIEGGYLVSALASVAAVVNYDVAGAEE